MKRKRLDRRRSLQTSFQQAKAVKRLGIIAVTLVTSGAILMTFSIAVGLLLLAMASHIMWILVRLALKPENASDGPLHVRDVLSRSR